MGSGFGREVGGWGRLQMGSSDRGCSFGGGSLKGVGGGSELF